jgi:hypothetical protein
LEYIFFDFCFVFGGARRHFSKAKILFSLLVKKNEPAKDAARLFGGVHLFE